MALFNIFLPLTDKFAWWCLQLRFLLAVVCYLHDKIPGPSDVQNTTTTRIQFNTSCLHAVIKLTRNSLAALRHLMV